MMRDKEAWRKGSQLSQRLSERNESSLLPLTDGTLGTTEAADYHLDNRGRALLSLGHAQPRR